MNKLASLPNAGEIMVRQIGVSAVSNFHSLCVHVQTEKQKQHETEKLERGLALSLAR